MASTPPHATTKAPSPMRLSVGQMARLYKLTLQVSHTLGRDVTPTAILSLIIGYGLTHAEQQRDLARHVRDGAARPWRVQRGLRSRQRAQPRSKDGGSTAPQRKGRHRDLGR